MPGYGQIGGSARLEFVVTDRKDRKKVRARWLAHDTDLKEGRDTIKIWVHRKPGIKEFLAAVRVIKGPTVSIEWGYPEKKK